VSRYAPNRTRTDPYTGLPWYLSERINFVGLWGKGSKPVPFRENCKRILETNPSWWEIPQNFFFVPKFVRGSDCPDLVICGIDEYSLSAGLLAGKTARVPVFCVIEDPPFTDRYCQPIAGGCKLEKQIRRFVVEILLQRCSGIFCFIEKDVLNNFNLRNVPLYQLMNGVSPQALDWVKNQAVREKRSSEILICYVGAINKKKGIDDLLEIFAEAQQKAANIRLRLIGPIDNDYAQRYKAKLHDLGLDSNVEITGWLPYEKMLEKLEECDICVYCNPPTEWFRSAQPLKVCEYLALSKPTIAWDYPGVRRLLDGGRLGILVPEGDKSAFVDALLSLTDPMMRSSIEKEIHGVIQGQWSSDYWYSQALDILAKAAE
jgi:glycosyltransferase involved in cell wall biosynthesis